MGFNLLFPGCINHAERGRSSILLLWSRTFSYWNSSIYCCEFLYFRLVSVLIPVLLSVKDNSMITSWNMLYVNDRVKKSLPEKYQKRTEASLVTALVSASLATLTCYPLDTIRRQMQMRGTPYKTVLDAFSGKLCH